MDVEKLILPAGIGFAALCILTAVAIVLRSRRTREQDKMAAEERERLVVERRKTWRRRLAVISLGVAFVIIFCIAGIAAWLSFGAQQQYAFDRNGGSWSAATGFALLLDAGALGLSLLRLFEALTARSSQLTRFYLVAFIVASATMNLLHAPHAPGESASLGGRLVAVIPPLVYAVFLETLLKKVEQLILGKYPTRKKETERGYSLLLWVPFVGYPWQMWKKWREDLHDTIQYVRAPGSRKPVPAPASQPTAMQEAEPEVPETEPLLLKATPGQSPVLRAERTIVEPRPVPHSSPAVPSPAVSSDTGATGPIAEATPPVRAAAPAAANPQPPARPEPQPTAPPQVSGDKPKSELLREALVEQVRGGDLRVLDSNSQVSNGAAYRANMQLGREAGKGTASNGRQEGLMADGAVRTAVKKFLPELRRVAEEMERARRAAATTPQTASEPAPEHRPPAISGSTHGGDETPEPQHPETLAIAHQREPGAKEETREAALA